MAAAEGIVFKSKAASTGALGTAPDASFESRCSQAKELHKEPGTSP
jgi:hypothetical protein